MSDHTLGPQGPWPSIFPTLIVGVCKTLIFYHCSLLLILQLSKPQFAFKSQEILGKLGLSRSQLLFDIHFCPVICDTTSWLQEDNCQWVFSLMILGTFSQSDCYIGPDHMEVLEDPWPSCSLPFTVGGLTFHPFKAFMFSLS